MERMRREYLWALVTIIVAILLAYVLLNIARDDASPQTPHQCADKETREKIQKLYLEGIDEAFRKHSVLLFNIWVQDEKDQPQRAQVGIRKGIAAYIRSRDFGLKYNPPEC